jgi:hypothetical protein
MSIRDNHPSGSVISIGGELRIMALRGNSREPEPVVLTASAAVALDATSLTVTAPRAVLIDNKFALKFGGTTLRTADYGWVTPVITADVAAVAAATQVTLTAAAPVVLPKSAELKFGEVMVTLTEEVTVGTDPVVAKCAPLSGAIAADATSASVLRIAPAAGTVANATASTAVLPTLTLRGLKSASQPGESNTISIRTMESGLGKEERVVMVGSSLKVEGVFNQKDRAYTAILAPVSLSGGELWAEWYSATGDYIKGAALPSGLSKNEAADSVVTYEVTIGFQGEPEIGTY